MTKREMIAQLRADDIKLVAAAAQVGAEEYTATEQKRIKRAVKILRSVKAAK